MGWVRPSASVTMAVWTFASSLSRATASPPATAQKLWDVTEARSNCTDRSFADSRRARCGTLVVTRRSAPSEVSVIEEPAR